MKKKSILIIPVLLFILLIGIEVKSQSSYLRWNCEFDTSVTNITLSPPTNNLWQVGSTVKPFFGAANSLPNAIMTDTANSYTVNANSSFIISFNYPNQWSPLGIDNFITLTFDHKYQTTAGHDGGAIEVSYDQLTWQNVLRDTFYANNNECAPLTTWNFYSVTDTLFNGEPGFSGQSNGWVSTSLGWCWFMVQKQASVQVFPDSMWVRFTFYSDSSADSLDGWMIDNMILIGDNPSGINELKTAGRLNIFPQPVNDILHFEFPNDESPESYSIYDITGKELVTGKISTNLIQTNQLSSGSYFLNVKSNSNRLYRSSFVKQ